MKRLSIVISLLMMGCATTAPPYTVRSNFGNQLFTFVTSPFIDQHARQMGYDYTFSPNAHAFGLKRVFYANANRIGVFYRDRYYKVGQSLISTSEYDQFACIRNTGTLDPAQRYYVTWVTHFGATGAGLEFHIDYRHQSAINAAINYFLANFDWSNIDAGYIDQADTSLVYFTSSGNQALFTSWRGGGQVATCLNSGTPDYTVDGGFLVYRQALRDMFYNRTPSQLVSSNSYNVSTYGQEIEANTPMDLYYNESGLSNDRLGIVVPGKVMVENAFPQTQNFADYTKTLTTAGIAGAQGSWFGSIGQNFEWLLNDDRTTVRSGMNAIQLLRAMPNWDNLVGATGRTWNGAVYASSNSYADNSIVYSRHGKNGKFFVVFRSATATATLSRGETVSNIQCVDALFIESESCTEHLAVDGTTVSLSGPGLTNHGYILTLDRGN
jgi:hypothetical protein